MSFGKIVMSHTKLVVALAAVAVLGMAVPCSAVELELPNAAEVQYFSPEAQQFYAAGLAALDKADYGNAYSMLAKAAVLQPAAIRLNRMAATVAIYQGRQANADKARDYYQTALAAYQNILRVPTLTADLRRQVQNELKLAQQEASQLPQRDAIREATGTTFILDYNRRYAKDEPRKAGTLTDASATSVTQPVASNPINQMMMQSADPNYGVNMGMGMDPAMMGGGFGEGMQAGPGMPGGPGMPAPGMGGMPGELPPHK